jgi:hypothetical protein
VTYRVALCALLVAVGCQGSIRASGGEGDEPAHSGGAGGDPSLPGSGGAGATGGDGDGDGGGDGLPDPPDEACATGTTGAPVPLRRLNASQVERTVRAVLGVTRSLPVTDEKLFTYRSNISTALDASGARAYLDFAEGVVAEIDLARCATDCSAWLLDEVGPRLFRRPLSGALRDRYQALYEAGGAAQVLEAMLQSPSFLYVDEVVDDDGYLDDYSIAARLAFVLWGESPDGELIARAERGELSTGADIRDEALRMLADERARGGLRDFVDQWLELHRLADEDSRPDVAALGPGVVAALREEPVALFAWMMERRLGLGELLTISETVRSDALTAHYGDDVLETSSDALVLDPERRAGILSLPGVMAALSHAGASSPTMRGFAVLSSFLCAPPPPPPAGVNVTLPEVGPDATARERLELHFSDDTCGMCHRPMDGIGFAFESLDWLGRSRLEQGGGPVDDSTTVFIGGEELDVDGVTELAAVLSTQDEVATCVARQWASYATGVPDNDDAACLIEQLGARISGADGLREMMLIYLTSDWFRRGAAP